MKRTILLLAVMAALLLAATATAKGGGATGVSTLTVSPAAPVAGDQLVFTGCGFAPTKSNKSGNSNQNLTWLVGTDANSESISVMTPVASNGCFTVTGFTAIGGGAGYQLSAFQGGNRKAFLSFSVAP